VSNTSSSSASEALGVATSALLGGPIAAAATALQDTSIATSKLSAGQIVSMVMFFGLAIFAGSTAYAIHKTDHPTRPQGLPFRRASEGTYSGTPYEIQAYKDNGKVTWWIHVHVAHKMHVEGLPSRKAAVTRVRRIVDYYRSAK
jgi:hypothetical protein